MDNRELNAKNPGIACRASKDMNDRMDEEVLWGNIVTGVDDGDGWLRMVQRYLPMVLDGQSVLVPAANGDQEGPEREYIVDGTSVDAELDGLYFCKRKDLSDRMPEMVGWGELVMGQDQGDGWLYMKPRFLPMKLQGVTVLSLTDGKDP